MSTQAKTVAAITSAIYACMGVEGGVQLPDQAVQQKESGPRMQVGSAWALSGRQAAMDRRYQVQFRLNR